MGIRWGSSVTCLLHGWTFSLDSGICGTNRYVLNTYGIQICGSEVYLSKEPINADQEGTRRDFRGQELIHNPGLGWI